MALPVKDELDDLRRESLKSAITEELKRNYTTADVEVLPEYVVVLVGNHKTHDQILTDLDVFLREDTPSFVDWLDKYIESNILGDSVDVDLTADVSLEEDESSESFPSAARRKAPIVVKKAHDGRGKRLADGGGTSRLVRNAVKSIQPLSRARRSQEPKRPRKLEEPTFTITFHNDVADSLYKSRQAKHPPLKKRHVQEEHEDNQEENLEEQPLEESQPDQVPTQEVCKFWPNCARGDTCPYSHPPICKYYPKCMRGSQCKFFHPSKGRTMNRFATLAMPPAAFFVPKKPNPRFIPCRFGAACKREGCMYMHPKAGKHWTNPNLVASKQSAEAKSVDQAPTAASLPLQETSSVEPTPTEVEAKE